MAARRYCLLLIVVLLASETGCCPITWCGSQCGQVFWNEWFSIPPNCHDPCNCCGSNVGPKNAFVRSGQPPMGRPYDYPPDNIPTPEQYAPGPAQNQPTSAEDLPPGRPSAGPYEGGYGQGASYGGRNRPVDSSRNSRRLGSARRLTDYLR